MAAHNLVREAISESGLSIYDEISADSDLFLSSEALESLLRESLVGIKTGHLPLRTRSKFVKEQIAEALGYPVPSSFKRSKPRFPGQNFDSYTQSANNLQVWNEEIDHDRRYAILRQDQNGLISHVRVIAGPALAALDTTGTLTQKFQARLVDPNRRSELITNDDTDRMQPLMVDSLPNLSRTDPSSYPQSGKLISIQGLFNQLRQIEGRTFPDRGIDQERNRGEDLHRLVCKVLGYGSFTDHGQFPDIRHQLLEVKLQTSPTIDLGLVSPDSESSQRLPEVEGVSVRSCDVRYAVFSADTDGSVVRVKSVFLTTGQMFFTRFEKFQGRVANKKIQIRLPDNFFTS